jgi:hypothetical protein
MKTNLMNYLSLIHSAKQPLHISGTYIAQHQEVYNTHKWQLVHVISLGDWQLAGSGWNCTYTVNTS